MHIDIKSEEKVQKLEEKNINDTEVIYTQAQETEYKPPKEKEQHVLSNDELIEYMYQHVQFDEIPFDSDPLYDHRQIYSHEMAHIEYGLYENIEVTAAFNIHMQNEKEKLI